MCLYSYSLALVLTLALVVSAQEESDAEVSADLSDNPAFNGHQIKIIANTESRKEGLKRFVRLVERNLRLKRVPNISADTIEKRGLHHYPARGYQPGCEYVYEYCYYPQDYCDYY